MKAHLDPSLSGNAPRPLIAHKPSEPQTKAPVSLGPVPVDPRPPLLAPPGIAQHPSAKFGSGPPRLPPPVKAGPGKRKGVGGFVVPVPRVSEDAIGDALSQGGRVVQQGDDVDWEAEIAKELAVKAAVKEGHGGTPSLPEVAQEAKPVSVPKPKPHVPMTQLVGQKKASKGSNPFAGNDKVNPFAGNAKKGS